MKYWDAKIETMSRGEMTALQNELLKKQVTWAYEKSAFYKKKFDDAGVRPEQIKTIADLARLPFTNKSDLRDNYPFGFCVVSQTEIVRVHASSGTTGKPTPVFHTKTDLENWGSCMARNCYMAGVRKTDRAQIAFRYTLFTGAFGHHLGVEKIGAGLIPTSSGQTERQILMMIDFRTTTLHCTPSYAIVIAEKLEEMKIDKSALALRLGVHGAEAMSEALRQEIEERLGIIAIGDYGLTELSGPGVSVECPEKNGYHINEDHFLPEIIDPETLQPLPDGSAGELVFTTLQKEAMPLIRYRTRDITRLERGVCGCGRTLVRHMPITGRSDDMFIIGGVNLFPSQIESVLLDSSDVQPHYLIHLKKKLRTDYIVIDIEPCGHIVSASQKEGLKNLLEKRVKDVIGISMTVNIVEPMSLHRSEGKTKRFIDER